MGKSKRSKACEFPPEVRERIKERDGGCIFCQLEFMTSGVKFQPTDIMHIVPRSQGGLGVEENGVWGCRYHHNLLDNGYVAGKNVRESMMGYIESYMTRLYPGWDKKNLVYKKGETR